jgi:hypothetical protein
MITQKEQLDITIKVDGNIEIAKQPIFIDSEGNQVGVGSRWRVAIMKGDAEALTEAVGSEQAQVIINAHWG